MLQEMWENAYRHFQRGELREAEQACLEVVGNLQTALREREQTDSLPDHALASPVPAKSAVKPLLVEIAAGELVDKLTILEIKSERITDPHKLVNVRRELATLQAARTTQLPSSEKLDELTAELKRLNQELWDVENDIRACESRQDFGQRFIALARSIYHTNDQRAAVKRAINQLLGSQLVEEKHYVEYAK